MKIYIRIRMPQAKSRDNVPLRNLLRRMITGRYRCDNNNTGIVRKLSWGEVFWSLITFRTYITYTICVSDPHIWGKAQWLRGDGYVRGMYKPRYDFVEIGLTHDVSGRGKICAGFFIDLDGLRNVTMMRFAEVVTENE